MGEAERRQLGDELEAPRWVDVSSAALLVVPGRGRLQPPRMTTAAAEIEMAMASWRLAFSGRKKTFPET